jgi:hypothetical protein
MKIAVAGALFCIVAILNCGGYRYGIGDQAFYVPAVVQHLNPHLFPRDRALLGVQDRLMVFDDAEAFVVRTSRVSLPTLSFVLFVTGLLVIFGAAVRISREMYQSWWATAALLALLTLRHRITQTGANSLEAYFQPRMLACGIGLWAVAATLRGTASRALLLVAVACLVHPTTGVWFGVWVLTAIAVNQREWRMRIALVVIAGAIAAVGAVMWGPLRGHLVRMDPRWAAALSGKDYIFPFDWTPAFWAVNFGYLIVILAVFAYRRRTGVAHPREAGIVAGVVALAVLFLASWPLMSAWIALALQLQTSRIFWMLDLLATIYIAWLLVDRPPQRIRAIAALLIIAVAAVRGVYVLRAEHAGVAFASIQLPRDGWTDAMRWLETSSPVDSQVLADPGHAWKYGTSVRVAAERDVYLEEVKDAALALYSRDVAVRVLDRTRNIGDFATIDAARARALAIQYDLDYLVIDRDMNLPLAYRNARFRVYQLR